MRKLFISFSGGETSAYMTRRLLEANDYDEVAVVFANTGQENEATLEFVNNCDLHFGFNTTWIEAVIHDGYKSPTARVVDFKSASRNGEPFEAAIRKYGIPNQKFKDCTRNLKLNPLTAYLESIGWGKGTYDTAIGIRVDEIDRMSSQQQQRRIIYPLISQWPTTKPQVNTFWAAQPFRLQLRGYQGNCKWCWKKSDRKHFTLIDEDVSQYEFPARMEMLYGKVGPEFRRTTPVPDGYKRTFFRRNRSTNDMILERARLGQQFVPASDDAQVFDPNFDIGAGCEESCEVFSDEDTEQ